jgi:hypothetical protein
MPLRTLISFILYSIWYGILIIAAIRILLEELHMDTEALETCLFYFFRTSKYN